MRRASEPMRRDRAGPRAPSERLGEHLPFDARAIAQAPALAGVYLLYRGHRLIYLGLAARGATIRQCLDEHLRGERGPGTAAATEFDYETSAWARGLYRHYMATYMGATGGLMPECNDQEETYEWLSCTG